MDKKIFSFDRVEGELAVCISDNDEQLVIPVSELSGLCVRDVFSASVRDGHLVDIIPMPEERDRRLQSNRSRLHALAKRRKNNS